MHCASCASIIEKTLKKTDGVEFVEVNYGNESSRIAFDSAKTNLDSLSKKIEPLGYSITKSELAMNMSAAEMGMSDEEHAAHIGIGQSKKEKLLEIREQ